MQTKAGWVQLVRYANDKQIEYDSEMWSYFKKTSPALHSKVCAMFSTIAVDPNVTPQTDIVHVKTICDQA